jgi:hypothetical protein
MFINVNKKFWEKVIAYFTPAFRLHMALLLLTAARPE